MNPDFKAILEHLEKRPKVSHSDLQRGINIPPTVEYEKWLEEHERLCKAFEKIIQKKRWENNLGRETCEKTLKQEHYNSMTPEQRNAQAYAVFSTMEGIYREILREV